MNNSPTQETPSTPSVSPDASSPDQTRRKLAGLGGAAILTLASRPVLAVTCNSPSAAASGNLSTHGTPLTCTGKSPSFWGDMGNRNSRNVRFDTVFASGTRANWGNKTLKQVMLADDNNNGLNPTSPNPADQPNPISKEFAATLLNIRDKRIPDTVLNETKLIGMWNEWLDSGIFQPGANSGSWDAGKIVIYLRSLQG